MKTETAFVPNERITTINFQPENYDAFPLAPRAWMDGRVVNLHRDREAVAHALILFPCISGRLHPKSGCSVDVAAPVGDLFLPRSVIVDHVEMAPVRLPLGTRTALLCDGSYRSAAMLKTSNYDLVFRLTESAYTTAIGPRHAFISSNFGLFAQSGSQLNALIPTIAAAVMLAEDLGISHFLLPVHDLNDVEAKLLERLVVALAAVNISLACPFLGVDFAELADVLPHPSTLEMFLAGRHEHSRSPEDLADLWFARLLAAQNARCTHGIGQAITKLKSLSETGHWFSPQESNLILLHDQSS